jgi:hypothetical protein
VDTMNPGFDLTESGGKAAPKAVILYDRLETMLAANQLLALLPSRTVGTVGWLVNSWRFDMLRREDEARKALSESSDAELVLVALETAEPLPHWSQIWIDRWAAGRKIAQAALGLVLVWTSRQFLGDSGLLATLRKLAIAADLRIFAFTNTTADADLPLSFQRIEFSGPTRAQPEAIAMQ